MKVQTVSPHTHADRRRGLVIKRRDPPGLRSRLVSAWLEQGYGKRDFSLTLKKMVKNPDDLWSCVQKPGESLFFFPLLLLQDAGLLSSGRTEAEHRESHSHPITTDARMCRQTNGRVVFTTSGSEKLPDTENHRVTFNFNHAGLIFQEWSNVCPPRTAHAFKFPTLNI